MNVDLIATRLTHGGGSTLSSTTKVARHDALRSMHLSPLWATILGARLPFVIGHLEIGVGHESEEPLSGLDRASPMAVSNVRLGICSRQRSRSIECKTRTAAARRIGGAKIAAKNCSHARLMAAGYVPARAAPRRVSLRRLAA